MPLDQDTIEWIKRLETENDALKKRIAYLEKIMYYDDVRDYEVFGSDESLEEWKDSYNKGNIDE